MLWVCPATALPWRKSPVAAEIEHRPLDHRGLRQHQGKRLVLD
jgi:hypothetical protein